MNKVYGHCVIKIRVWARSLNELNPIQCSLVTPWLCLAVVIDHTYMGFNIYLGQFVHKVYICSKMSGTVQWISEIFRFPFASNSLMPAYHIHSTISYSLALISIGNVDTACQRCVIFLQINVSPFIYIPLNLASRFGFYIQAKKE